MIFSGFGVEIAEAELCVLCDCTALGTDALKAVDAARHLSFSGSAKHNLTFTELTAVVAAGQFPIVFLDFTLINGCDQAHAAIVTAITPFSVQLLDPDYGERVMPHHVFNIAWGLRRKLTIIVEK